MPSTNYAYVNGRFVPENEATVSIFDRGFLYGDGVFETMRVYGGQVFRAFEHFDRLRKGARALAIQSPLSPEELHAVCRALIRHNVVSGGVARICLTRDSLVATVQTRQFEFRTLRAVITEVCVDPQLSRFKTANRLPYILAHRQAINAGADEAVLLNRSGNVVEFSVSNLFAVKNERLYTPPLDDGPLPGITRAAVLSLANDLSIETCETSLEPSFLDSAAEVFATNSLLEIAPVAELERLSLARPEMSTQLHVAYRQLVARELNTPGP
jgi:branched-chain amino acid aminotransferase